MSADITEGVYVLENVETQRYLFQDGAIIKGKRGDEGGWAHSSGFQAPPVLGTDANYHDRAYWKIIPQGHDMYFIENVETQRYLFQDGEKIKGKRGNEGGWSSAAGFQAPSVLGTDANYYNRAYWKIIPQVGDMYIIENVETGRYLFQNGNTIKGERGDEGGWSSASGFQAPSVLGADANYYNRAYWKLVSSSPLTLSTTETDRHKQYDDQLPGDLAGATNHGIEAQATSVTPQMSDGEATEIVKKAMESGCIKQRNTVAIVTGIMGAGKSTFLKRLFQQDIPSSYTSTGVMGDSYRGVMGHLASLCSLEYMPRGRILKLLAPLLKLGVPEGDVEAVAQIFMDAQAVSTPRPSSPSSIPIVTVATTATVSKPQPEPTYSQYTLKGLIKKEEESDPTAQTSADRLELDLIHVLDTGGQPECMEVMPTLIHNSDLVILVLNLAQGLECCTTPFCAEEGKRYEKSTLLQRQNKQIIRQLIRTMQAKRARSNYKGESRSSHSRFLVVGTHRDCIKPAEYYRNVLDACSKELKKLFGQVVEDEQILYKGSLIFPLNLQEPEREDENVLRDIREDLRLPDVEEFDLPLSFFMFEQDAYKYVEKKARAVKVLSLKECVEIGAELKMSRETVQAALLYLHKHNVFLYFHDILPDLVFLDPQVPLELVNAMVRLSYKVKSKANEFRHLTPHVKRCLSEGIITEELLKHEDLSMHFVPDMYQPHDAITLFQKIYTIAPLGEAKRGKEYVTMCLLPDKTEDEIRSLLPSSPRVQPLLVHFENDCAPIGCFGNTVSCLMMKYGWDLLRTSERKPQCLAHNVVQFSDTPTVPMEITLVSCTGYFEVHVNPKNSQEEKHCPQIRLNVVSAIEHVLKKMHYDISIKPAFLCQCTHTPWYYFFLCLCNSSEPDAATTEPHAATVIPPPPTSSFTAATVKCTVTNRRYDVSNNQRVWIEKRNDQTESMDDRPTLNELIKFGNEEINVIEKIGCKYHNFGTKLLRDDDGSKMGALEGEKRGNAEDISNAVLSRWIRGEGREPRSWATLATVLDECQLSTFADVIRSVKATPGST